MNQILMTENRKRNRRFSGPMEIANIVKFFAIAIMIFGMFFIGQGSYAIYKQSKGNNTDNMPVVNISRINDTANIKVISSNIIENLIYSWNDAEETVIPVGNTFVEEDVMLPVENSILNISIEDETGRIINYQKEFIIEGLDINQPTIDIKEEGTEGNIKITATDETAISYITYKVNDEDEIRIDKSETENKAINYILKLPRGENKIIITAVDESGNIETLEKTIIVSGKSNIRAEVTNGQIIFIVEDQDGVRDIEINLNGLVYAAKDINATNLRVPMDLEPGANTISIKVTNVNSLVTVVSTEYNYEQ